jgi:hypothetical protein
LSDAPTAPAPARDRSRGLRVFGGILIALGLGCLCLTGLMLLGIALNTNARWEPAILYAAFAAACVVLGFGSIQGRRWARDLVLVGSAFALAFALLSAPFAIWMVGRILAAITRMHGTQETVGCVVTSTLVFMFAVFVSLPLVFVLFYARRDVRQTVERLDPVPRWTQAQPLPVLGAALLYAGVAAGALVALVDPALPTPGGLVTGAPARLWVLAGGVVSAAIAWGLYRGKRSGWVAAVALTVGGFLLSYFSLRELDFQQLQQAMADSEEGRELMSGVDLRPGLLALVAVSGILWLAYLFWIRKYFQPGRAVERTQ